jgi:nitrate/nitrite transporter NarK
LEIIDTPLTGRCGEVSEPHESLGKEPMTKTILITGTIGMIVGFGGTRMPLFGGGTLQMEYLEFVVMLVLFQVMLLGAYWFVMVNPREEVKKPTP